MSKPIWLLDIDGVLNTWPKYPRHMWGDDFQEHVVCDLRTGKDFRIVVGQPVIDFINDVHVRGLVDIRWHTTWQRSANEVAKAFGLPLDLPVADAPEFDLWDRRRAKGSWKIGAARRLLESTDVPVIWTDDDLGVYWLEQMRKEGLDLDRLTAICPDPQSGLSSRHMRMIMQVIDSEEG